MREAVLHWAWKNKIIQGLEHYSKSEVTVHHTGQFNENRSGPDFFNARVSFDDLQWHGSIEIHYKSSDWYAHKHQNDVRYENVVLHVVAIHDKTVHVHKKPLPTLVVSPNMIDLLKNSQKLNISKPLLCKNVSKTIAPFSEAYLIQTVERRIHRKFEKHRFLGFTEFLALGFGGMRNGLILLEAVQKKNPSLLSQQDQMGRQRSIHKQWISYQKFLKAIGLEMEFILQRPKNLKNHLIRMIEHLKQVGCTNFEIGYILNNAILPYFYLHHTDANTQQELIAFHKSMPSEKNKTLTHFKNAGFPMSNALQGQAYLEIYTELCTQNKCLKCPIGKRLLCK